MTSSPTRARGRPSDPAKRDAILDAARALFFSGGPDAVSMEAVAREAGVSKVTLYAHFAHRNALIRAVIMAQHERLVAALHEPVDDAAGLRRSLSRLGLELMHFLCSDDFLLLERLLAAHLHAHPGLGRLIYEHGPLATVHQLARLLDRLNARGLVRVDDSRVAAEQLIGMWLGILGKGLMMKGRKKPNPAELWQRVEDGIDTFIRAFGVVDGPRNTTRG